MVTLPALLKASRPLAKLVARPGKSKAGLASNTIKASIEPSSAVSSAIALSLSLRCLEYPSQRIVLP